MRQTPYDPIIDIDSEKYYTSDKKEFCIIKTDIYSKECLKNYFIKDTEKCPITDIIVEPNTNNANAFTDYEMVEKNKKVIYYRIDNKFGKIYGLNGLSFFNSDFDYKTVEKIKLIEENKILNPLNKLKIILIIQILYV